MEQKFQFDSFACVGDVSEIDLGNGWTVKARLEFDQDTRPTDYDCYEEKEIDAWKRDEWFFCGIVLDTTYNGIEVEQGAASLWGIDCNFPGSDNSYLATVAHELLDEALERSEAIREEMVNRLTA